MGKPIKGGRRWWTIRRNDAKESCIPRTTFPRVINVILHTTRGAFRIMSSGQHLFLYQFWVAVALFILVLGCSFSFRMGFGLVGASRGSLVQVGLGLGWTKDKTWEGNWYRDLWIYMPTRSPLYHGGSVRRWGCWRSILRLADYEAFQSLWPAKQLFLGQPYL